MSKNAPKCSTSQIAIAFWRERIAAASGFDAGRESFSALILDHERRLTGAHAVPSKSFGDPVRFADELFQSSFLGGVPEFVLVHHRPGTIPAAGEPDVTRVRAVILAGRSKKCELLDCLIIGKPDDEHPSGSFSFHKIRGFYAVEPFSKPLKKGRKNGAEMELQR